MHSKASSSAGVSTRREPRLAAGQTLRAEGVCGSARADTARRILCHGASTRPRSSCAAWLDGLRDLWAVLLRRRTFGCYFIWRMQFEPDHALQRLRFTPATVPPEAAKPKESSTAHRAWRQVVGVGEAVHFLQFLRSVLSFSRASSRVCHCMFSGASSPPHASGVTWSMM